MKRPWKENQPASPHKLLNAYVHEFTEFTPLDGDPVMLGKEDADAGPVNVGGFDWEKIHQGASVCWFG